MKITFSQFLSTVSNTTFPKLSSQQLFLFSLFFFFFFFFLSRVGEEYTILSFNPCLYFLAAHPREGRRSPATPCTVTLLLGRYFVAQGRVFAGPVLLLVGLYWELHWEVKNNCSGGFFSRRQQCRFRDRQLLEAQTVAGSQTQSW